MKAMLTAEERRKIRNRISRLTVDNGDHEEWEEGHCVMEIVNKVSGSKVMSDKPLSACAFSTELMIAINDSISDSARQELKKLVPFLVRSNSINSHRRAYWLIKTFCLYAASKSKAEAVQSDLVNIAAAIKRTTFSPPVKINSGVSPGVLNALDALDQSYCRPDLGGAGELFSEFLIKIQKEVPETVFVKDFICIMRRSLKMDLTSQD
jgi:hypothetical protein